MLQLGLGLGLGPGKGIFFSVLKCVKRNARCNDSTIVNMKNNPTIGIMP